MHPHGAVRLRELDAVATFGRPSAGGLACPLDERASAHRSGRDYWCKATLGSHNARGVAHGLASTRRRSSSRPRAKPVETETTRTAGRVLVATVREVCPRQPREQLGAAFADEAFAGQALRWKAARRRWR